MEQQASPTPLGAVEAFNAVHQLGDLLALTADSPVGAGVVAELLNSATDRHGEPSAYVRLLRGEGAGDTHGIPLRYIGARTPREVDPQRRAEELFGDKDHTPGTDTWMCWADTARGRCPSCRSYRIYLCHAGGMRAVGGDFYEPDDEEPWIEGRFCLACGAHSAEAEWGTHPRDRLRCLGLNVESGSPGPSTWEVGILEITRRKRGPGCYWRKVESLGGRGVGDYAAAQGYAYHLHWGLGLPFDEIIRHHTPCSDEECALWERVQAEAEAETSAQEDAA